MRYFFFAFLSIISLHGEEIATKHTVELQSGSLEYTAIVGSLPVQDEKGEAKGEIFYTAYLKEPFDDARPITFAFNGGPGSSSVWLHMGTLGPRRVLSPEEGQGPVPPYELVDNKETLLDLSDLVFIDPIGTGFSKANTKEDAKNYYDIEGDVVSVGDFIRDYITHNKRWNSPKYIAGESYGTLRACGLAQYLQSQHGMYLNGLILISCAIDFSTLEGQFFPYILSLPTYATTAWYHGRYRTDATLEEVVDEARRFAFETYAPALLQPQLLGPVEKEALYEKISFMTGIDYLTIKRNQGMIEDWTFFSQFFPDQKKMVGRFDTRYIGDFSSLRYLEDPSAANIDGVFTAAFHAYLHQELNKPASYRVFSEEANRAWNFTNKGEFGPPNYMNRLSGAMAVNPKLRLLVCSGYFDAATPFAATEYCFNHLPLPESYQQNIEMKFYSGGHMYYLNPKAREQFKEDLISFYTQETDSQTISF